MAITGEAGVVFTFNDRRTIGLNANANLPATFQPSFSFTDGAGVLAGNILYQNSLLLTAGTYNLDLAASLSDSYGTLITAVRIKVFAFRNNSASNVMTLGAHATAAWVTLLGTATSTLIIRPGGVFMAIAPDATGHAVTATTADILKIAGTGTDGFDVLFVGAST